MTIRLIKTTEPGFKPLLKRILDRRGVRDGAVDRRVSEIVGAVQKHGDRALLRYTAHFDGVRLRARTHFVHGLLNCARVIDIAADHVVDLEAALAARFVDWHIDLVGHMAVFSAVVPPRPFAQTRRLS